jgi:hypothetical protein
MCRLQVVQRIQGGQLKHLLTVPEDHPADFPLQVRRTSHTCHSPNSKDVIQQYSFHGYQRHVCAPPPMQMMQREASALLASCVRELKNLPVATQCGKCGHFSTHDC